MSDLTIREVAAMGGRARAKQLTRRERAAQAKRLNEARWAGKPPVTCPVCGSEERTVRALQAHRTTVHPGRRAGSTEAKRVLPKRVKKN